MEKQLATFEDFSRLDIRVGTILTAQPFPKASSRWISARRSG